jgi:hypothetical protein
VVIYYEQGAPKLRAKVVCLFDERFDFFVERQYPSLATSAATNAASTSRRNRDREQHHHGRAAGVGHSGTTGLLVAGCDTRTTKVAMSAELVWLVAL